MVSRSAPRRRDRRWLLLLAAAGFLFLRSFGGNAADAPGDGLPSVAVAGDQAKPPASPASEESGHGDRVGNVLLALFLILIVAKLGGDLMERVGQPAVLGELLFGVVIGNIGLLGISHGSLEQFAAFLRHDVVLETIAEIGVVLLLFQIGLESTVAEMRRVGLSAFLVAALGVVAPFLLGWGTSRHFLPGHDPMVHVYVGAVLCATSVGITARVLQDIGKLDTNEAKIILGAAVIDDVMGLIILAVVMGVIQARDSGASLEAGRILVIVLKSGAFFIGSILLGALVSPKLYRLGSYLRAKGVLLTLSLALCFFLAWLASQMGLAPIVGAFCAGLILEEASFQELGDFKRHDLEELISPIVAFLVPVFFVRMGVLVHLETFAHVDILGFALVLTLAAIVGKQVCAFGVRTTGVDRLAVGIGMIPRGEVGLIVAKIGMGMTIAGEAVIEHGTYSAVVIMVIVTTLITPPILSLRFRQVERRARGKGGSAPAAAR